MPELAKMFLIVFIVIPFGGMLLALILSCYLDSINEAKGRDY